MMVFGKMFAACLVFNLFAVALSKQAAVFQEFQDRLLEVKILSESYDRIAEQTSEEAKEAKKKEFMEEYEEKFNKTDVWIFNVIVHNKGNKELNLLAYAWDTYKNDLNAVRGLLEGQGGPLLEQTRSLRLHYAEMANETVSEVKEVLDTQLKEIRLTVGQSVDAFMTRGWIQYFNQDCKRYENEFRKDGGSVESFVRKVEYNLSKMYSFRTFLAFSYDIDNPPAQCDSTAVKNTLTLNSKIKVAVHSTILYADQSQFGKVINVPETSEWAVQCRSQAGNILHEMVRSCGQFKVKEGLLAVVPKVDFSYSVSMGSKLKTRVVKRWFLFFCKRHYQLMYFA